MTLLDQMNEPTLYERVMKKGILDKLEAIDSAEAEEAFNQKHRKQKFETKSTTQAYVKDGVVRKVVERKVTTRKPWRWFW